MRTMKERSVILRDIGIAEDKLMRITGVHKTPAEAEALGHVLEWIDILRKIVTGTPFEIKGEEVMNEKVLADMRAATKRNETIVLSGKMHDPAIVEQIALQDLADTSDAERDAVLKASAMIDLADSIESRIASTLRTGTAALRLSTSEWELITFALRTAAE